MENHRTKYYLFSNTKIQINGTLKKIQDSLCQFAHFEFIVLTLPLGTLFPLFARAIELELVSAEIAVTAVITVHFVANTANLFRTSSFYPSCYWYPYWSGSACIVIWRLSVTISHWEPSYHNLSSHWLNTFGQHMYKFKVAKVKYIYFLLWYPAGFRLLLVSVPQWHPSHHFH